ncbi:hypothetical protein HRG_010177 [Hirsutella rhossiliensis]|uniref:Uncharacterized protein n=1 Tax=Hirsutella rhossiliensis TaxID=111463 RepID=A0A9P8SEL0_9HYPO|nr:uncharacterized protein HRG_10177 [Hirsutella rhossiliensis]KAH0958490.1 hypothetical protein HRG_10177 [Hirsutella rhossiliensis]
MAPHWGTQKCPKADRFHWRIRDENKDSSFCPFCGKAWPQPIVISDTESPAVQSSPSNQPSAQVFGPARPSARKRDRTINFQNHWKSSVKRATAYCRTAEVEDPYDHPLGLPIRVNAILSRGEQQAGFFLSKKQDPIGVLSLTLSHTTIMPIAMRYCHEECGVYFEDQLHNNMRWEIGSRWQKLHSSGHGGLKRVPHRGLSVCDLFFPHDVKSGKSRKSWDVSEGHIVVWIAFQVEEPNPRAPNVGPKRKRKRNASPNVRGSIHIKKERINATRFEIQSSRRRSVPAREDNEQDEGPDEGQDGDKDEEDEDEGDEGGESLFANEAQGPSAPSADIEAAVSQGPAFNTRHLQERRRG